MQSNGQLFNAAAYRDLIVTYRNGSPVRLKDVGRALDSVQNDKVAAWFYSSRGPQRSLILAIQRQPGTNTVQVAAAVKKLLPIFRDQLPASVNFSVLFDRSLSIRESVNDVEFTLLLAVVLVILVIFFFLRNLSATIIPSLALPFSIMGTFAVMYLFGYSLNNLSLMALTLSIGFLVDDAIVMLENIFRHQELGEGPRDATLNGSQEIGFTIVSMTLSLAAVFLPILFMGGILGKLFHEFAVTIAAAVLISGLVSLTLTPMLSSRILRPPKTDTAGCISPSRSSSAMSRVLQDHLALGHGTPPPAHGFLVLHPGRHGHHVHQDSQGLHPQRRHGTVHRRDGGRPGNLL